MTLSPRPTCHFDRNGAKRSGVEKSPPQWHQCLPSHCHFDRNGAKRSGVEKSPAPMVPVPPPPTLISTETEQSGVEWRNLQHQWYQCLPLPLSFRPERSKAEWSGEISSTNGTSASPSHSHFDRNGAKRSGVEKSPAPMAPVPPLPLSFRPQRSKAEWSGEIFSTNGTSASPSHCHFDRNGAKRSGEISRPNGTSASPAPLSFRPQRSVVEKSPDSVGQAPMRWEISRLRVSMIYKYFIPISTRSPARDDMWAGSEPSLWEISKHRSEEKGTVKKYHIFSSQFLFIFLLSCCLPDKYQFSVFSASSSHFS
jgi:hypothetical protein